MTPEYNNSDPVVLKNAIDSAPRPYGDSAWSGNPAAIMGASVGAIDTAFDDYFTTDLARLADLAADGLVEVRPNHVRLREPVGRLLVRVVATAFDRCLPASAFQEGLSAHESSKVG